MCYQRAFLTKECEMVNKDFILRNIELMTRRLTVLLGLRRYNKFEEALIYVDDLYLQSLGLTASFVHSVSEEMLLQLISPVGVLNVEKCLWLATLLKAEGDIYDDMDSATESYYHYLKSLYLFLVAFSHERMLRDTQLGTEVVTLLDKLEEYELPLPVSKHLFTYYELNGQYAQAEDTLFELLDRREIEPQERIQLQEQGKNFYTRLLHKTDADLLAGNMTRDEVEEGITQL
jgi:hypothetical protein